MKKLILILMIAIFGMSYSNGKTVEIVKSYNLNSTTKISLEAKNATIKVIPTETNKVIIKVQTNEELSLIDHLSNNKIVINIVTPKNSIFSSIFKSKDKKKSKNKNTFITLEVPQNYHGELNLLSTNGKISASKLSANLSLKTVNGLISLSNISGNIRAQTTNGNINITNSSSITSIETTNGQINAISKALLKGGSIKSTNGKLDLKIDKLEGDNVISTINGSINLTTPKDEININVFEKKYFKDETKNITISSSDKITLNNKAIK